MHLARWMAHRMLADPMQLTPEVIAWCIADTIDGAGSSPQTAPGESANAPRPGDEQLSSFTRRSFITSTSAMLGSTHLLRPLGFAQEPATDETSPLVLWYDRPAKLWVDALPIGNGSLGAMVFGGGGDAASPEKEVLQLNDDTLWSGYHLDGNNKKAKDYLAAVRDAVLMKKDYHLADSICEKVQGSHAESYQPLGNLRMAFRHAGAVALGIIWVLAHFW